MVNLRVFFDRSKLPLFVASLYLFLYIPIIVLILFSFNKSVMLYQWSGFSFDWYKEVLQDKTIWAALYNSIIVAGSTVILSLILGLLFVYYGAPFLKGLLFLFYGALIVPEIVLAVGLLSFFSILSVPLGFTSLIAGHTVLGLGYTVPILYIRFKELEHELIEASLDLGATVGQTFFKIILPLLSPAMVASALLVFIVSLDDFIIAFFCASPSTQTLPLYIFSVIRAGASQMISALSVILLLAGSLLILLLSSLKVRRIFFLGR